MKSRVIVLGLLSVVNYTYAQWNLNGATSGNVYYNGGNVGIGTDTPKEKFQIEDRWIFHRGGHKVIAYDWHFFGVEKRIVDDEALVIRFTLEGDIHFSTAPYLLMNSTVGWQTPLFLANSGRVDLNAKTPLETLEVGDYNSVHNKISIPGVYNFENFRLGQFGNCAAGIEFIDHTNLTESYGFKLLTHVDQAYGFQIHYATNSTSYSNPQYRTGFFMGVTENVGIGTITPSSKTTFKSTFYSTEVKVDVNTGTGPDFVFELTYNLPTLAETEAYTKANKQLPEVPFCERDGREWC